MRPEAPAPVCLLTPFAIADLDDANALGPFMPGAFVAIRATKHVAKQLGASHHIICRLKLHSRPF